jgi:hypothetical protein
MILTIFILASVGVFATFVLIRYLSPKATTSPNKSSINPKQAKKTHVVCHTIARAAKAAPAKYYEEDEEEGVSKLYAPL